MPQQIQVPGMGVVEFPDGMSDDQIVSAIKQNMPQQQAQPSFGAQVIEGLPHAGMNLARDALTGLFNFGSDAINAPHNIASYINPGQTAIPALASQNLGTKLFAPQDGNVVDRLVQGAAQYAPYALGGEAALGGDLATTLGSRLAAQGLTGATFGATQSVNPVQSGLIGAAGNAGLGLGGAAASAFGVGIKNFLSQFAGKGILDTVGDSLNNVRNVNNQQAFNLAKQNFENYSAQEKPAWNDVTQKAAQVDSAGVPFDNSGYVKSLQDQLSTLGGQSSRQSAYNRANADSIDMLNGYAKDQTGTFTDAIEHNKALNQDYQNEITPGKSLPFSTVNFAKANLQKTLQSNLDSNNPLVSSLNDSLKNANAITQQKNQIFNQVISSSGKPQNSKFAAFLNGKNQDYQDPSTFVNDYLPNGRADGTQKMQQFSQMVGDEDVGKNVIKQNYFGNAITDDGIDPKGFLNKYNNLSSQQQTYLFNPEENQAIQALNKINKNNPKALNPTSFTYALHASVPALFGAMGSSLLGHGWESGAMVGGFGYPAMEAGLRKAFSISPVSNAFVNSLTRQPAAPNPYSQFLANALSRGTVTPQAVNQFGAQ
jgi:hypothetical protein